MQAIKNEKAVVSEAGGGVRLPHNVIVEDRSRITATGITRINSYDENSAVLETGQGTLTVGGSHLQVSELSIQSGELKISGEIEYLQYTQPASKSPGGLLRRLVR